MLKSTYRGVNTTCWCCLGGHGACQILLVAGGDRIVPEGSAVEFFLADDPMRYLAILISTDRVNFPNRRSDHRRRPNKRTRTRRWHRQRILSHCILLQQRQMKMRERPMSLSCLHVFSVCI